MSEPNEAGQSIRVKRTPGRKKVDRGQVVQSLSDALFGPKEVSCLKVTLELKGDVIGQVERGFLIYCEACNVKGRVPNFNEFIGLAIEPGLKQVFKYQMADSEKAHENAKRLLGESTYGKKKTGSPVGEKVD